jgi:large subunit ribosomal protein L21
MPSATTQTPYAVVELGGKQYRVERGQSLLVDRIDAKPGATVKPRALLFRDDDALFEGADLDKVTVEAVVSEHVKGEKLRVFKYRPKKRYRKRAGHRSLLTRLEIKEIKGPAAAKAAAGSAEGRASKASKAPAKAEGDAGEKPKQQKAAGARKPATRGGAAAKKES